MVHSSNVAVLSVLYLFNDTFQLYYHQIFLSEFLLNGVQLLALFLSLLLKLLIDHLFLMKVLCFLLILFFNLLLHFLLIMALVMNGLLLQLIDFIQRILKFL
mmetsp:Transcript_38896/g.37224  ORF Transcript_38896/g.37224 Transcript_38896/m.37224 type:complete len:102 (+) Transcript_38896:104-409(+)